MIYNPLFKILRSPKREKKHPLLNEISGWKVKYTPPFLQFSGRTSSRENTPLPEILGTRMRSLRPRSGGGGGGGGRGSNPRFIAMKHCHGR